jgi:hypothetical protein
MRTLDRDSHNLNVGAYVHEVYNEIKKGASPR